MNAQYNYAAAFKEVDKLVGQGSYNQAYPKAEKIFLQAQKDRNSQQMLRATYVMNQVSRLYQEDHIDSALNRYQRLIPQLDPLEQSLCNLFLAQFYNNYYNDNRWRIRRNAETDERDLDYKLWSQRRIETTIRQHAQEALRSPQLLQQTSVEYASYCCDTTPRKGIFTTPTLYDLVAQSVATMNLDRGEVVQMWQALLDFHQHDATDDLRIWIELKIAEVSEQRMAIPTNEKTSGESGGALQELLRKYRNSHSPMMGNVYHQIALQAQNNGHLVEAVSYCDTAIARYSESEGGVACFNLRQSILQSRVMVEMENDYLMPERDLLAEVRVTNADHLYYRIVKYPVGKNNLYNFNFAALPVLKQWDQPLSHYDDYQEHRYFAYLPPMPAGNYCLLVSVDGDFKKEGYYVQQFSLSDAQLLTTTPNGLNGLLLSRTTGSPIPHHKVEIINQHNNKITVVGTTRTDAEGFYHFDPSQVSFNQTYGNSLRVQYQGTTLTQSCYKRTSDTTSKTEVELFLDRPIYRPGDTLHLSLLCYKTDHRYKGSTEKGRQFILIFLDINNKTIDTLELTTDAYGTADGTVKIPTEALPGTYRIQLKDPSQKLSITNTQFTVEHYKQPKFLVTMPKDHLTHHFGQEIHQQLIAVTYSGVPVGGAQVSWRVIRQREHPWRWYFQPTGERETVATGSGSTSEQGAFEITFVPQPDTAPHEKEDAIYRYTLIADVTDLNGETHSQTTSLRISASNSYLTLLGEDELREASSLRFQYRNLDDQPLGGEVRVVIEQVEMPQPLLCTPFQDEPIQHTLSQKEFESRYPLLAYHKTDLDPCCWARKIVATYPVEAMDDLETTPLQVPALGEGLYCIKLSTVDDHGDTITTERYYTLMPSKAKNVYSQQLLWSDVDKHTANVGDQLTLRLGTRFSDVHTYCLISTADTTVSLEHRVLRGEVQTIPVPIEQAMLGGFDITLLSVKENVVQHRVLHIEVPFEHKQLKVEFATFRDKLLPGQPETWTVKVCGASDPTPLASVRSNILMTMYDAALESYKSLEWTLNPWHVRGQQKLMTWNYQWTERWNRQRSLKWREYKGLYPQGWTLSNAWSSIVGWVLGCAANGVKNSRANNATQLYDGEDAAVMETSAAAPQVANKAAMMDRDEAVANTLETAEGHAEGSVAEPEVQIRENLSTLGFFMPNLRSDKEGKVTFTFTAPEALTQWNIQGMAWTRDLCVGDLKAQTVTQKPLMVVPNAPRFMREGDTVRFVVKVSNMTDTAQSVKTSLEFSAMEGACIHSESVTSEIAPHASVPVEFGFVVPRGVSLASYKVVARSDEFSDGEQAPVVVLSNRELVTESMSMYINGEGEKTYRMKHLMESGGSQTLEHHGAVVEFTSNPIWYAVQSLPYIADREDPSNIYRANVLYANSLSQYLLSCDEISKGINERWLVTSESHRLTDNEATLTNLQKNEDLKQTLLEETPWLQEAQNEQHQKELLAQFFDKAAVREQLDKNRDLLTKAQMSSGGWSWIPGGRYASEYITQYILQLSGQLQQMTEQALLPEKNITQALYYVDRQTYDYYQKWDKKSKDCNATHIDYLYTRSFYPRATFMGLTAQAYNYYYNNALKQRNNIRDLYTQAQLALIFHRHGDAKAAVEMARKLKGSALYSDEMGMYWRDNVSGLFWNQRPIQVQSLLIQVFDEVLHDEESVSLMQQWLLKQKQTTRWNSDIATANAVAALMREVAGGGDVRVGKDTDNGVTLTVGGLELKATEEGASMSNPVGYQRHRWKGTEVSSEMGEVTVRKSTGGIGWGAFYWQYFEELDKIPYSEMGVKMQKQMYLVKPDGTLSQLGDSDLKVGSRVRVRIMLECDRNLEYVELKDGRASCMEPVSTASGWSYDWHEGLGYYLVVGNASQSLFIDRLDKGKYVVEYDCWITHAGTFNTGSTRIQCHYAPEFRSEIGATRIRVGEKRETLSY